MDVMDLKELVFGDYMVDCFGYITVVVFVDLIRGCYRLAAIEGDCYKHSTSDS